MKNAISVSLGTWLLGLVGPLFADSKVSEADLVLFSDHVISMSEDSFRESASMAVAVNGERISWIGPEKEAAVRIGEATKVMLLGSQSLLPGFIDAHEHASYTAAATQLANLASPPVGPVTDIPSLQEVLRKHIDEKISILVSGLLGLVTMIRCCSKNVILKEMIWMRLAPTILFYLCMCPAIW